MQLGVLYFDIQNYIVLIMTGPSIHLGRGKLQRRKYESGTGNNGKGRRRDLLQIYTIYRYERTGVSQSRQTNAHKMHSVSLPTYCELLTI